MEEKECCDIGTYKCCVSLPMPEIIKKVRDDSPLFCLEQRESICVDKCIAAEIQSLWDRGIRTTGCCCGHGKPELSYIGVVEEDIEKMKELGYKQTFDYDLKFTAEFYSKSFIPKDMDYKDLQIKTLIGFIKRIKGDKYE